MWNSRVVYVGLFLFGILSTGIAAPFNQNLLSNPGAEGSADPWVVPGWTLIENLGDGLATTGAGGDGTPRTGSRLFATSYEWMRRSQTLDLLALGFTAADMDQSPDITVGEWMQAHPGEPLGGRYFIKVELRNAALDVIATWNSGTQAAPIELSAGATWQEESHTFSGYPAGVRYVYFEDGGKDRNWWAGNWGTQFDDAYVKIANPAPVHQIVEPATTPDPSGPTENTYLGSMRQRVRRFILDNFL